MSRLAAIALAALLVGCASAPPLVRDSFSPGRSKPSAVALLERMISAAGGRRAWSRVREIGWLEATVVDARVRELNEFAVDRLNQRFRLVSLAPSGVVTIVVGSMSGSGGDAYRLLPSGCLVEFMAAERARLVRASAAKARQASFALFLPFSLLDETTRLTIVGQRSEPTVVRSGSAPRYDLVRVQHHGRRPFDLVVEKKSGLPILIEESGRSTAAVVGSRLRSWERIGDLMLATRRTDLASTSGSDETWVEIPPEYQRRVKLERARVPREGAVTLISLIEAHRDIDERLFSPAARR